MKTTGCISANLESNRLESKLSLCTSIRSNKTPFGQYPAGSNDGTVPAFAKGVMIRTFSRLLATVFASLCFISASAENLYVTPSGAGSHTGLDWNNAWSASQISWGSVTGKLGAGDTLWFAGGSYSGGIDIRGSGTSGSRIYIKRAVATDSACTSAAGWVAGYDSTVTINGSGTTPLGFICNSTSYGSYVTIDGVVPGGFLFNLDHRNCPNKTATGALVLYYTKVTSFEFKRAKIVGVAAPHYDGSAEGQGMQLGAASPNQNQDILISEVEFTILGNVIHFGRNNGVIIEKCKFHDNSTRGGTTHGNEVYMHIEGALGPKNVTFRYNESYNNCDQGWYVACDMTCGGQSISGFYMYGNVFHDIGGSGCKCISLDGNGAAISDVQIYNNTFVNCDMPLENVIRSGVVTPTGSFYNNILYNSGTASTLTRNYNWYSGSSANGESHGYAAGSANPFVNLAGKDFRLTSATPAGATLTSPYNADPNGVIRGGDGTWDRGAYEYALAGPSTNPPTITQQPTGTNVAAGQTARFSMTAAGSGTLAYQWRKGGINIAGATLSSYSIASTTVNDSGTYSVVVGNVYGSATSGNAVLNVGTATSITTQPTNVTVVVGQPASFRVVAAGTGTLAYQWRKSGVNIAGATQSVLSFASTAGVNAGTYSVVVTNMYGSATSGNAVLNVGTATSITSQPTNVTVVVGQPASFTVVAAGTPALAYQWRKSGVSIVGATQSVLAFASTVGTHAGTYSVVVTNLYGSVTSSNATLTVQPDAQAPPGPPTGLRIVANQ